MIVDVGKWHIMVDFGKLDMNADLNNPKQGELKFSLAWSFVHRYWVELDIGFIVFTAGVHYYGGS